MEQIKKIRCKKIIILDSYNNRSNGLRIRRSGVRISPGAPEKTGSYDSGRNSLFLCPAHLQARCKQKHLGGYQPSRVPMGRAFPPSLLHLTSRGRCPANQAKNLCFVPATTFLLKRGSAADRVQSWTHGWREEHPPFEMAASMAAWLLLIATMEPFADRRHGAIP